VHPDGVIRRLRPDPLKIEVPDMPLTRIERWDVRRDGPLSEAALQRKIESRGFELAARIYPAAIAAQTSDDRASVTAVVQGKVRLTIDGEPEMLSDGDVAFMPAGVERRLEAVASSTALCLEGYERRARPGN
jgi:hypothetical protein